MTATALPQITPSAYFAVRTAFVRSLPGAVTPAWVTAQVPSYKEEKSAKGLIAQLKRLGLVDAEARPTELARRWRVDDTYADACGEILRFAFPPDIVDAVEAGPIDAAAASRLFLQKGFGLGSSKNLARILLSLAARSPEPRTDTPVHLTKPSKTRKRVMQTRRVNGGERSAGSAAAMYDDDGATRYLYALGGGRYARLSAPADMTSDERKRLIAHLRIDLIDEVHE